MFHVHDNDRWVSLPQKSWKIILKTFEYVSTLTIGELGDPCQPVTLQIHLTLLD